MNKCSTLIIFFEILFLFMVFNFDGSHATVGQIKPNSLVYSILPYPRNVSSYENKSLCILNTVVERSFRHI